MEWGGVEYASMQCMSPSAREARLEEEQLSFIDGCPEDWRKLPIPEGRILVGLDGGYICAAELMKSPV